MLSNAYFLAKFRFDTAEIEPVKNLKKLIYKNANPGPRLTVPLEARAPPCPRRGRYAGGPLDFSTARRRRAA